MTYASGCFFAKFAKIFTLMITMFLSCLLCAQENLVKNADFKTDADANGIPDGWGNPKGVGEQGVPDEARY